MDNALKIYDADSQLARLIRKAAEDGKPLRIRANGAIYIAHVVWESDQETSPDIWADYDPEKVRDALEKFPGVWSDFNAEQLKDNLFRAR